MENLIQTLAHEINSIGISTVAKRSGLSRQHLYKILSGSSHPTSENLEALGQAVSCKIVISRSKYYPANPAKEQSITLLVDIIKRLYDPQEIWIFGSQARGDWTMESDIDLMIVGQKSNSLKRGEIYVEATRQKIRDGFDAVFVSLDDFAEKFNDEKSISGIAVKEGIPIYTKDLELDEQHSEAM